MLFCENDDNMLYIKIDDESNLIYYCKLCCEEYNLNDLKIDKKSTQCVYKQNYNTKNYSYKTFLNKNMFKDPTLPRIKNLKCPYDDSESNTQGKNKEVIYIKYSAQNMGFLYSCTLCERKWTGSSVKLD